MPRNPPDLDSYDSVLKGPAREGDYDGASASDLIGGNQQSRSTEVSRDVHVLIRKSLGVWEQGNIMRSSRMTRYGASVSNEG